MSFKIRHGQDGIHLFDRSTGLNILIDEMKVPVERLARAPRFVSFALTNLCDLRCRFCYAPKTPASLDMADVLRWSEELAGNECLGVGFGGGEPTLYPQFVDLCRSMAENTDLSVSFTTHAHCFSPQLRDRLCGAVNFIRVSMDGVGQTYEKMRGRPFPRFIDQLQIVADTSDFGINYVVNSTTVDELDEAARIAYDCGAKELLLLPEFPSSNLATATILSLEKWISKASLPMRLSISETSVTDGMPVAEIFMAEKGVDAYVHVNANGAVSASSYRQILSIPISRESGILDAIETYKKVHV